MNAFRKNLLIAMLLAGAQVLLLFGAEPAKRPEAPPAASEPKTVKSPVAVFRELLDLTSAERRQALSNRPPEIQKLMLAKVREYETLSLEQRELRLGVTELRWYLMPLMKAPSTNRGALLALVPKDYRPMVQSRLIRWEMLPPALRQELLENEATIRYYFELEGATSEQRTNLLESLSPTRRFKLEQGIQRWQAMPEDKRQKLIARFDRFFDFSPQEKQKALNSLSAPEQQELEKTLRKFDALNPLQRAKCIRSFEKFASLSAEERQQFLKNAERWKLMTRDERQAWRNLVEKVQATPWPPKPKLPSVRVASPATASTN